MVTYIFMVVSVILCIAVAIGVVCLVRLRKEYSKALKAHYEACCLKYEFAATVLDYARHYGLLYISEDDESVQKAMKIMGYDDEGS